MQLRPAEQFTIVRQLDNPADNATYYVQAVIRNSKTDEIIDTVQLVDRGNQRFTQNWQVTNDTSGQGTYVDIETSVYTDPAYTVYSDVYSKMNSVLLVLDRQAGITTGAGGGRDINYQTIEKIVKQALDKQEKPKSTKVNLGRVYTALEAILTQIKAIQKPQKTNFSPIIDAIVECMNQMDVHHAELGEKIDKKEIPKTDLTPILEKLETIDPKIVIEMAQKQQKEEQKKVIPKPIFSRQQRLNTLPERHRNISHEKIY